AMQDLAASALKGRTVILITHDPLEAARLAHHAQLMRADGLHPLPLPVSAPPRALSDPATLTAQAALYARLMQVAA
ncbi:MAG: ABC transporter ATP-binding protein, partial [Rhodobacterales bacterium]|nr:ABC transporter ATP-binding protein [Rhodobacterales bacterium]